MTARYFVFISVLLGLISASPVVAQQQVSDPTFYWVGGSGLWEDPLNWSLTPGGPGGDGPPRQLPPDVTYPSISIVSSDATDRIITFSSDQEHNGFNINSTGAGIITLNISGDLHSAPTCRNCPMIIDRAIVNQTAGGLVFFNDNSLQLGSHNIYNMSGGQIGGQTSTFLFGGIFNQNGGSIGLINFSVNGTYNLNAGGLNTNNETLDITSGINKGGVFNQNGGSNDATLATIHIAAGGAYNLAGGTFVSQVPTNDGVFNFSGGQLIALPSFRVLSPLYTNNGTTVLSGAGVRTMSGDIINTGTFKVSNTTAVFDGTFTNRGAYLSDPAKNFFQTLFVDPSGYLVGGAGDEFHFAGDFLNHSTNPVWDTVRADLFFGQGEHAFYIGDTGIFSWDDMWLDPNTTLALEGSATLHVHDLHLYDLAQLDNLPLIQYDQIDYLGTHVPEPSSLLLLSTGLIGLMCLGWRRTRP